MKMRERMILSVTCGDLRVVGAGRQAAKVAGADVESKGNMEKWNWERVKQRK